MQARSHKTWQVTTIVLIGFICSLYYYYRSQFYQGMGYPWNTFLFNPQDVGNDFYNILLAARNHHPYNTSLFVYFPFTYALLLPLTYLNDKLACCVLIAAFLLFLINFISSHLGFLQTNERRVVTAILALLSYPTFFCLDRCNIECLVFIFCALFLQAFQEKRRWQSILFLSFATAMKVYPGVLAILYLTTKKKRDTLYTAAVSLALTLVGMGLLAGGFGENLEKFKYNLIDFSTKYIIGNEGLHFSTNWFTPLKLILFQAFSSQEYQSSILTCYSILCFFVFCGVTLYVAFLEKTLWKQVFLLEGLILLLPQVSFDYKLIHLFLPLVLFLSPSPKKENGMSGTLSSSASFSFLKDISSYTQKTVPPISRTSLRIFIGESF